MIQRIFENRKTTAVGVVIFLTGVMLVATDKATLTEFSAFIGVAFALFFSKDPKAPKS
jgi:hypothetical protein